MLDNSKTGATVTAKRYLSKPYDFSFSGWATIMNDTVRSGVKVYRTLRMRVGEQQKLKEFDLSNPLVGSLKNATAKYSA